ncbi:MAG: hypothetical protein P8129_07580 [Anaerolineae bacterium]
MAEKTPSGFSWQRLTHSIPRGLLYILLILGACIMILPFLWMLSTSVMTIGEANAGRLLPRSARLTCPYVNLVSYDKAGTVTGFAVAPEVRAGAQELPTDSYYVEIERNEQSGEWQGGADLLRTPHPGGSQRMPHHRAQDLVLFRGIHR